MDSFKGKVVVLTGASEGIGRALALSLAGAGARLVLASRNAERLASLSD
jgi:NAD(P)-dependent dehydrogenase (short-subunit alcohol dehydrogenase family)